MLTRILAGLIVTIAATGSAAYGHDCQSPADRTADISRLEKEYGMMLSPIEAVPPAEAEYIHTEMRDSLALKNKARFDLVYANRYFQAVMVRDAADDVMKHLVAAEKGPSPWWQGSELIDALLSAGKLVETVSEYISADRQRASPVLSQADAEQLSFSGSFAKGMIAGAAKCYLVGAP